MDKTSALVIFLGIFVGLVYALASQPPDYEISSWRGSDELLAKGRGGNLLSSSQMTEVISKDVDDLDDLAPMADSRNNVEVPDSFGEEGQETACDRSGPDFTYVQVTEKGLVATSPGLETSVVYQEHTVATLAVSEGETETVLSRLNAVIVDRIGARTLVILPTGSEGILDELVEAGSLSSYTIGGWGSGLGKA